MQESHAPERLKLFLTSIESTGPAGTAAFSGAATPGFKKKTCGISAPPYQA